MFPLIPLALSGVSQLGRNTIETWHNLTQAKTSTVHEASSARFDDFMKKIGETTNTSGQPSAKEIHTLTHKLMHSPELQAALAGGKSPEEIGLQIAPDGTVSMTTPGGGRQNLILSPTTQALAQQVGQARSA